MAKKKPPEAPPEEPHNAEEEARPAEAATPDADFPPEVEMAEAALRRAEAELRKAKRHYCRIRRRATETIRHARQTKVSDVVEGTLEQVKKHPASGVLIAAGVGFFVGRLFRR